MPRSTTMDRRYSMFARAALAEGRRAVDGIPAGPAQDAAYLASAAPVWDRAVTAAARAGGRFVPRADGRGRFPSRFAFEWDARNWTQALKDADATAAAYNLPVGACRSAFHAAHAALAESVAQEADDQYPGVFYGPSDGARDDAREAAFGVILPETDAPAADVSDAAWEITESAWQVIRASFDY